MSRKREPQTGSGIRTHRVAYPAIHGDLLMYDSAISDWRPLGEEAAGGDLLTYDSDLEQWVPRSPTEIGLEVSLVSGAWGHWDISDSGSVTTSGSDITAVSDQTANSHDLGVVGTPELLSASQNGLDVAEVIWNEGFTIDTNAWGYAYTGAMAYYIVAMIPTSGFSTEFEYIGGDDSGGSGDMSSVKFDGTNAVGFETTDAGNFGTTNNPAVAADTYHLIEAHRSDVIGTAEILVDGEHSNSQSVTGDDKVFAEYIADLFGDSSGEVRIAEVVVYRAAHATASRVQNRNFLAAKWSLTVV